MIHELGESIHLVVLNEKNAIFIDKLDVGETIFMGSYIGWVAPLYCTASGKLLLGYQNDEFIEDYLKAVAMKKHTYKTITDLEKLKKELKNIKQRGYSLDNEEMVEGLICCAAPIFDKEGSVLAAVSVSGPASQMKVKNDLIINALTQKTSLISKECDVTPGVSANWI